MNNNQLSDDEEEYVYDKFTSKLEVIFNIIMLLIVDKKNILDQFLEKYSHLEEQGTDAWKAQRATSVGGSEIGKLVEGKGQKDIIASKIGFRKFEGNIHTMLGNLNEPNIEQYMNQLLSTKIYETGSIPGMKNSNGDIIQRYSPDGLSILDIRTLKKQIQKCIELDEFNNMFDEIHNKIKHYINCINLYLNLFEYYNLLNSQCQENDDIFYNKTFNELLETNFTLIQNEVISLNKLLNKHNNKFLSYLWIDNDTLNVKCRLKKQQRENSINEEFIVDIKNKLNELWIIIPLFEFKCPTSRIPDNDWCYKTKNYKYQTKAGADTINFVEIIVYVDAVFRNCSKNMLRNKIDIVPMVKKGTINQPENVTEAIGYVFIGFYEKQHNLEIDFRNELNELINTMNIETDNTNQLNNLINILTSLSQNNKYNDYLLSLDKIPLIKTLYKSLGNYLNTHTYNMPIINTFDYDSLTDLGTLSCNELYDVLSQVFKHKTCGVYYNNGQNLFLYDKYPNTQLIWQKFARGFLTFCEHKSYKPIGILSQKLVDVKYIINFKEHGFLESHRTKLEDTHQKIISLLSIENELDRFIEYHKMFNLKIPQHLSDRIEAHKEKEKEKQNSNNSEEEIIDQLSHNYEIQDNPFIQYQDVPPSEDSKPVVINFNNFDYGEF